MGRSQRKFLTNSCVGRLARYEIGMLSHSCQTETKLWSFVNLPCISLGSIGNGLRNLSAHSRGKSLKMMVLWLALEELVLLWIVGKMYLRQTTTMARDTSPFGYLHICLGRVVAREVTALRTFPITESNRFRCTWFCGYPDQRKELRALIPALPALPEVVNFSIKRFEDAKDMASYIPRELRVYICEYRSITSPYSDRHLHSCTMPCKRRYPRHNLGFYNRQPLPRR
ncbi:hypothetical protein L211DRAFT_659530 [Terfezia boudieri ATCC MYA-4762]|uniref:Uncharacterized protein n=1 Tax=Terfezia boudieri ATCC MYA-4762 TaxID=1051890 RepID=A0A3N4LVE4_9PEZI|nr:hypothetical protein L211DRAFT_659530 [Terfezia boudieri ATCC MYA-4762]